MRCHEFCSGRSVKSAKELISTALCKVNLHDFCSEEEEGSQREAEGEEERGEAPEEVEGAEEAEGSGYLKRIWEP